MRILAVILAAVTTVASAADPLPEYPGYYVSSFERSLFKPVGSSERWWLSGKYSCPGTDINLMPSDDGATPPVFLVVSGKLSAKGKHGHMGAYDRELVVERTVSCRLVKPDERVEF